MGEVLQRVDEVGLRADQELAAVRNGSDLERFRVHYLGSKGLVKGLMELLREVPREQKPAFGQKVNAVRTG